jgi:hypothetical protein
MVKKVVVAGFGFMGMTHTLNIPGNRIIPDHRNVLRNLPSCQSDYVMNI